MKKGVYTAACGKCGQPNYMHIDGVGGFDPKRCRACKINFISVTGGKNNEYKAQTSEVKVPRLEEERESDNTFVRIQKKGLSKSNLEKKYDGSFRLKINAED
jgi:hypothetical protein